MIIFDCPKWLGSIIHFFHSNLIGLHCTADIYNAASQMSICLCVCVCVCVCMRARFCVCACSCVSERQTDRQMYWLNSPHAGWMEKRIPHILNLVTCKHDWSSPSCGHFVHAHTHSCKLFQGLSIRILSAHTLQVPDFLSLVMCHEAYRTILQPIHLNMWMCL